MSTSSYFSKRWGTSRDQRLGIGGIFYTRKGNFYTRDQRLSSKRPSRPKKWPKLRKTAMGTRTRSPCPALALQNAPQTDAIHEDRARAFQKKKTSCQGRPMKAHALPCLKPLMICTLPRSPYKRQHDAMRCCCHAHGPRYCLPLLPHHWCHSATTALLCTTTACCVYADDATLLLPRCCYLAILASNTPTKQNKANNQAVPSTSKLRPANQARNLQLSVTATTAPVASITTPVSNSPQTPSPPPLSPRQPACLIPDRMPSSTSPPFPTGGEWDHPPLRGRPRRPTPAIAAKETKPPNPPPSGKRGSKCGFSLRGV